MRRHHSHHEGGPDGRPDFSGHRGPGSDGPGSGGPGLGFGGGRGGGPGFGPGFGGRGFGPGGDRDFGGRGGDFEGRGPGGRGEGRDFGGRGGRRGFRGDEAGSETGAVGFGGGRGPGFGGGRGGGFGPGPAFGPGFGPGFGGGPGGRGRGFGGGRSGGPGGPGGPRGRRSRGNVRAAVLALLAEEPRHGYALITEIAERSEGLWRPSPGSVYPMLQQLQDEGLITEQEAEGRRVFSITDTGRTWVTEHESELANLWTPLEEGPMQARRQIHHQLQAFGTAVHEVFRAGDETQIAQALAVIDEARRSLYRILAGDTPAPETPADEAPTDVRPETTPPDDDPTPES